MEPYTLQVRAAQTTDHAMIQELQLRYLTRYPGASFALGDTYRSPGLSGSASHICAVDQDQNLIGYAALYPALVSDPTPNQPVVFWAEMRIDPDLIDGEQAMTALLDCLVSRARTLLATRPERPAQLVFQVFPFEEELINFLYLRGYVHTESIYQLKRDLALLIPTILPPPGMTSAPWRMESAAEVEAYVRARNSAFPEAPISVEGWRNFTRSPLWRDGACLAVFDGADLAGSICLFWDDEQNRLQNRRVGSTEFLFVLTRWRGLGLGTYLVAQGLAYLKKHGLGEAQLEVKAPNVGALGLYTRMGYCVTRESWFLENTL